MDLKLVPRINGRILSRFGLRLERTRPSKVLADQGAEPDPDPPSPSRTSTTFRYRTGNWTYTVPVERMVSRPIFGYGPRSWHPLKAGCAELLDNIDAPYESSILRRFYATFTPSTVAEAYRLIPGSPLDELKPQSLFEPWLLDSPPFDNPHADAFPAGTPLFGPVSEQEGQTEWRRLRRSVSSVLEYGYQPDLFPRGRIAVSVLRSRGGAVPGRARHTSHLGDGGDGRRSSGGGHPRRASSSHR